MSVVPAGHYGGNNSNNFDYDQHLRYHQQNHSNNNNNANMNNYYNAQDEALAVPATANGAIVHYGNQNNSNANGILSVYPTQGHVVCSTQTTQTNTAHQETVYGGVLTIVTTTVTRTITERIVASDEDDSDDEDNILVRREEVD